MFVRAIGLAVSAMVLNTFLGFLWLWFHSAALAPGHDPAFYQAYADRAAPVADLLAGIPLLFAAGWLAAALSEGRAPVAQALLAALVYSAIDLALLLRFGPEPVAWGLALFSWISKLAAAGLGARAAVRSGHAVPLQGPYGP